MAKIIKNRNNSLKEQLFYIYLKQSILIVLFIFLLYISLYFLPLIFVFIILFIFLNGKKKRICSGLKGEKDILDTIFNNLSDDYIILPDINITNDDKIAKIDFVVIGKYKIFVIEVKNFRGKIFGDLYDNKLIFQKNYNKVKEYRYNPYKQNATHMWALKNLLFNYMDKKYYLENIVVFNDYTELFVKNSKNNIVKLKNLINIIQSLDFGKKNISELEKQEILKIILKDNLKNKKIKDIYKYNFSEILKDKDVVKFLSFFNIK